ncbi:hybrid sensor histidine kinase/response regulator [Calditrichota bacterium GD2]
MDQDFERELLEIFKAEAEDYLNILNDGLLALEEGTDERAIEEMFRTTHSLKGAARAVNFSAVEELCQAIESLFSKIKNKELELNEEIRAVLNRSIEHLNELLNQNNFNASCDIDILNQLQAAASGKLKSMPKTKSKKRLSTRQKSEAHQPETACETPEKIDIPQPPPASQSISADAAQETIRISYQKIRELFTQSEELIAIKIKQKFYIDHINQLYDQLEAIGKKRGQWLAASDSTESLNAELFRQFSLIKKQVDLLKNTLENDLFQITAMIDKHLDDIKQLMMFPFSTITNYLERSTRGIAREMNKKIELKIYGKEVELDKHTLELLKDPLIHLIRNSLDHGIEPPEERLMRGKPEVGKITIEVLPPREQSIVIKVSDDGRGLDLAKIKQKSLEKNLVTQAELDDMNENQALSLIFRSGLSTKDEVSKLSGRGLGMAVVLENIEKLGGSLKVENYYPNGSTFYLTIPLSFATSRGILIRMNDFRAIIPTKFVRLPVRLEVDQLKTVENQLVVNLNGQNIPLFSLASLLAMKTEDREAPQYLNILILRLDEQHEIAVSVDQVLDEREIILKKLNPPLEEVRFLSGVTILGDGSLVPVLNVHDIFMACFDGLKPLSIKKEKAKQILVVEDSITSRVLLKNVLESAGFEVQTAVNGRQAWQILQKQTFDLIVSDVQMPEMDGIELTRKIKAEQKMKSIPVILLTSLGSESDRKKGLEAGANAYFIKQDFKQKSLLDLIHKLIGTE